MTFDDRQDRRVLQRFADAQGKLDLRPVDQRAQHGADRLRRYLFLFSGPYRGKQVKYQKQLCRSRDESFGRQSFVIAAPCP